MKRIAWIAVASLVGLAATGITVVSASPKKPPLTVDAKIKLIQKITTLKPTGLLAPVRLSARKLYEANTASIVVQNPDTVDAETERIGMHTAPPGEVAQKLTLSYKPGKANQTVLIDVYLISQTNGPAKVQIASGSVTQEISLGTFGEDHLTMVSTSATTAWQTYTVQVTGGNVAVSYIELTPTQ